MSEFEFDIVIDDGHDIDSFLDGPKRNQYIEQIVSVDHFKLLKRVAKGDDEVNIIKLASVGREYIIRGDRSSKKPIVPKGHAWIAVTSTDLKSLSAFNEKVEKLEKKTK